jgi:hypothetical protein
LDASLQQSSQLFFVTSTKIYLETVQVSESLDQEEIDERVKQAIEMEDPDVVIDLRRLNSGSKTRYDTFWDECKKFLEEEVGTAVDDRRHSDVTHIAKAISIRDFRDQVASRCLEGILLSQVWNGFGFSFGQKIIDKRVPCITLGSLRFTFESSNASGEKTREGGFI